MLHVQSDANRNREEDVLQEKEKQIFLLEARLEAKQAQILEMQAKKQSSDAATQFTYSDVAECKPEVFHAYRSSSHLYITTFSQAI